MDREKIEKLMDKFKMDIRESLSKKGLDYRSRREDYHPDAFEYKALRFLEEIEKEINN